MGELRALPPERFFAAIFGPQIEFSSGEKFNFIGMLGSFDADEEFRVLGSVREDETNMHVIYRSKLPEVAGDVRVLSMRRAGAEWRAMPHEIMQWTETLRTKAKGVERGRR